MGIPEVLYECLFCGKEFWNYKKANRIYCSKKCDGLHKYIDWKNAVFQRDEYVCQKCGIKFGQGQRIYLHAHHKKPFSKFPNLRYVINNGTTLCKNCHYYGKITLGKEDERRTEE